MLNRGMNGKVARPHPLGSAAGRFVEKGGTTGLVVFGFLLVLSLAIVFLEGLPPPRALEVPIGSDSARLIALISERFGGGTAHFLAIEADGDLYSSFTLARLAQAIRAANSVETVKVISIASMPVIKKTGESLSSEALLKDDEAFDASALRKLVDTDPFARSLFLSPRGRAWTILLFLPGGQEGREAFSALATALDYEFDPLLHIAGEWSEDRSIATRARDDLLRLLPFCLALTFIALLFVSGSVLPGILLWVFSTAPCLWIIAAYSLAGIPFGLVSNFVPVLVLTLSTSYTIQFFRHFSADARLGAAAAIRQVARVMFYSALTTALGFGSLVFSRIESLSQSAAMLTLGIVLALGSAAFCLPAAFVLVPKRLVLPKRFRAHLLPANSALAVCALLAALLGILSPGVAKMSSNPSLANVWTIADRAQADAAFFVSEYGGSVISEIIVDSATEYGLLEPKIAAGIRGLSSMKDRPFVLSYIDLADWINGAWQGAGTPLPPEGREAMGESLELAFSFMGGTLPRSVFFAQDYRIARVFFRAAPESVQVLTDQASEYRNSMEDFGADTRAVNALRAALPESCSVELYSPRIRLKEYDRLLKVSLVESALYYLPIEFLILALVFRSFKFGFLGMVPTILGILFFFGAGGMAGIGFDASSGVMMAAVMGVSADDAIHLITAYRSKRLFFGHRRAMLGALRSTAFSVLETTIVIIAGLSVLLVSHSEGIARGGAVTVTTLAFCTATTLAIVPASVFIASRRKKKGGISREEP